MQLSRRWFGLGGLCLLAAGMIGAATFSLRAGPALGQDMTVWRSPSCGCCGAWIEHMEAAGYSVTVREVDDVMPAKRAAGVPDDLASCHTAMIDGYVVEGHVPADVVDRLLSERPEASGIAVPGMPAGSPGMEVGFEEPYDVILFGSEGRSIYDSR
jgi:hypothetical protein